MRFIIGEHDGTEDPLDRDMFRAYFYWLEDGVEQHRSFSIEELESQISECREKGEPTQQLELALARLRRMSG